MKVKIWGTRGSIAVSNQRYHKFGGNTTCIQVTSKLGTEIIVDSGSGIRDLGSALMMNSPVTAHLLYTHYHWDHIQGFPFFVPAFIPGNTVHIYGQDKGTESVRDILENRLMSPPNFPVPMSVMGASLKYHRLKDRGRIEIDDSMTISYAPLNHPNGVLGFRFEEGENVFTFLTDIEHTDETIPDKEPLALSQGAKAVAYDSQYTPEEYPSRVNWGHSTYVAGLNLVKAANAEKLLLIHHDPGHDDEAIEEIEEEARKMADDMDLEAEAAFEGMEFTV